MRVSPIEDKLMFLTKSNITYIFHISVEILCCSDQDCAFRKFAGKNESVCKTGQRALGSCFDAKMNQLDINEP